MRSVSPRPVFLLVMVACVLLLSSSSLPGLARLPSLALFRGHRADFQADRILLVSAYFPLKAAKHSLSEYDAWLTNFMGQLDTDMYIFCPPTEELRLRGLIERAATLKSLDSSHSGQSSSSASAVERKVYFDTRFNDCLETPVLASFAQQTDDQWSKDVEKNINNPDLYAIWNSKAYFVGEAVRNTTSRGERPYRYYFWQDAGAMRTANTLQHWPSMERTEEVFWEAESQRTEVEVSRAAHPLEPEVGDALVMFPFWRKAVDYEKAWTEEQGGIVTLLTEGSFFGGSASSVLWFETAFYRLFDKLLAAGQFIGRDQDVFNTLIAQFPSHFFGPIPNAHNDLGDFGRCGDRWYYYVQWIASAEEREAMESKYGWVCPLIPLDYPFL